MVDYNSVEDILNAGTSNMTYLINDEEYDDDDYLVSPPKWLKINSELIEELTVSGNSYIYDDYGDSNFRLNVNQRDAEMYYLYKEEGTLGNTYNFFKIRWRGYPTYNDDDQYSSNNLIYDVLFFDTGDIMIYLVAQPEDYYDGTFSLRVGSNTYSFSELSKDKPYATFYSLNENNSEYQDVDMNIINFVITKKLFLLQNINDNNLYTITDNGLTSLNKTDIASQSFIDYGFSLRIFNTIYDFLDIDSYKLLYWIEENEAQETVKDTTKLEIVGLPETQYIIFDADIDTNKKLKGFSIRGEGKIQLSFDNGSTFKGYNLQEKKWQEGIINTISEINDLDVSIINNAINNSNMQLKIYLSEESDIIGDIFLIEGDEKENV